MGQRKLVGRGARGFMRAPPAPFGDACQSAAEPLRGTTAYVEPRTVGRGARGFMRAPRRLSVMRVEAPLGRCAAPRPCMLFSMLIALLLFRQLCLAWMGERGTRGWRFRLHSRLITGAFCAVVQPLHRGGRHGLRTGQPDPVRRLAPRLLYLIAWRIQRVLWGHLVSQGREDMGCKVGEPVKSLLNLRST